MVEKSSEVQNINYDAFPYGWGEVPALGTPVELESDEFRTVRGLTDLRRESTRFGPLRSLVQKYKDRDHEVGLQYKGPRSVRVFVADKSDSIKKVAVVGVVTGVAAGVVFLHEYRKSKK